MDTRHKSPDGLKKIKPNPPNKQTNTKKPQTPIKKYKKPPLLLNPTGLARPLTHICFISLCSWDASKRVR